MQMDLHLIYIRLYDLDTKSQSSQTCSLGSKVNSLLHFSFKNYINCIWRYWSVWLYRFYYPKRKLLLEKTQTILARCFYRDKSNFREISFSSYQYFMKLLILHAWSMVSKRSVNSSQAECTEERSAIIF